MSSWHSRMNLQVSWESVVYERLPCDHGKAWQNDVLTSSQRSIALSPQRHSTKARQQTHLVPALQSRLARATLQAMRARRDSAVKRSTGSEACRGEARVGRCSNRFSWSLAARRTPLGWACDTMSVCEGGEVELLLRCRDGVWRSCSNDGMSAMR